MKKWTWEEIKVLLDEYGKTPIEVLSVKLNKSKKAIYNKAYDLRKRGYKI